jgi:flagellar basal-body rod protein FlgB
VAISGLKLFSALKAKMQWHEARQGVLAQNIANADTPNYRARDLKPIDFDHSSALTKTAGLNTFTTHPSHFNRPPIGPDTVFDVNRVSTFETTPEGNSVVLEEEMMKSTANQLDYQTATVLYQKSMGLLRTALGRRG